MAGTGRAGSLTWHDESLIEILRRMRMVVEWPPATTYLWVADDDDDDDNCGRTNSIVNSIVVKCFDGDCRIRTFQCDTQILFADFEWSLTQMHINFRLARLWQQSDLEYEAWRKNKKNFGPSWILIGNSKPDPHFVDCTLAPSQDTYFSCQLDFKSGWCHARQLRLGPCIFGRDHM